MTPAEARRCGLRLADALSVIADEMVRADACPAIITAHANCAIGLCDALAGDDVETCPDGAEPHKVALALESDTGAPADALLRWADAWRTWGA